MSFTGDLMLALKHSIDRASVKDLDGLVGEVREYRECGVIGFAASVALNAMINGRRTLLSVNRADPGTRPSSQNKPG